MMVQEIIKLKKERELLPTKTQKDAKFEPAASTYKLRDKKHYPDEVIQQLQIKETTKGLQQGFEAEKQKLQAASTQFSDQFNSNHKEAQVENSNLRQSQQSQIEALKKELEAEKQQLHDSSEEFKSTIEQLKSQLKTSQKEKDILVQTHKTQIEKLNKELEALREQFQDDSKKFKSNNDKLEFELKTSKEEKDSLRQTHSNKTQEWKQKFKAGKQKFQEDSNQLKSRIEQLQRDLKTSHEDKDALEQAHTNQTQKLKQGFQIERQQFLEDSNKLKPMIEKLQCDLKTSHEEKDALRQSHSNQIQELKQVFETKQQNNFYEIKKLKSAATEHERVFTTLEEKLSTSQQENICFKDQLSKMTEEFKAEKQQLELLLAQKKINQTTADSQNALALAVEERNLEKVSSILKYSEVDINLRMTFEAKKIEGPVLVLAIQNGHFEMIKMLVQDFGANVSQEITVERKPTSFVIFGMRVCFEK